MFDLKIEMICSKVVHLRKQGGLVVNLECDLIITTFEEEWKRFLKTTLTSSMKKLRCLLKQRDLNGNKHLTCS